MNYFRMKLDECVERFCVKFRGARALILVQFTACLLGVAFSICASIISTIWMESSKIQLLLFISKVLLMLNIACGFRAFMRNLGDLKDLSHILILTHLITLICAVGWNHFLQLGVFATGSRYITTFQRFKNNLMLITLVIIATFVQQPTYPYRHDPFDETNECDDDDQFCNSEIGA